MTVVDNFLQENVFKDLQEYSIKSPYEKVEYSNKKFSVLMTPNEFIPFLKRDGYELILTFIRSAYNGFDDDLNIHADGIVNGHKIDEAAVLFINERDGVTPNGTCFYIHKTYGSKLPEGILNNEYDRLLKEDSNNPNIWEKTDSIASFPNRLLIYNSNKFHSKYPANIEKGTRIVLVAFYKKK